MFFNHFDGYLRVAFSNGSYGDLNMDLTLHGHTTAMVPRNDDGAAGHIEVSTLDDAAVRTWLCASQCPFPRFIAWLEAVVVGVQECAFQWDGEGPDGELRWFDLWKSGRLRVSWLGKERFEREVRLNKAQMVRAFYGAFRGFVESNRYDPLDYEELTLGEALALVLDGDDLDAVAEALARRFRGEAFALMEEMRDLAFDREAGYPRRATLAQFIERATQRKSDDSEDARCIPMEWDCWAFERRRLEVLEVVFKGGTLIAFGSKLRELRSSLVEAWLAREEQTETKTSERNT